MQTLTQQQQRCLKLVPQTLAQLIIEHATHSHGHDHDHDHGHDHHHDDHGHKHDHGKEPHNHGHGHDDHHHHGEEEHKHEHDHALKHTDGKNHKHQHDEPSEQSHSFSHTDEHKHEEISEYDTNDQPVLGSCTHIQTLPFLQDVGLYLLSMRKNVKQSIEKRNMLAKALSRPMFQDLAGKEFDRKPKVVVLSIRIKNLYDERGSALLRRNLDEAQVIEQQVELSAQFLQIISEHVYAVGGDIIHFCGDRITACLSGESEEEIMRRADPKPSMKQAEVEKEPRPAIEGNAIHQLLLDGQAKHQAKGTTNERNCLEEAVETAIKIQKDMDRFLTHGLGDSKVGASRSCLIGIGLGECQLVHVGGVFLRQEFFSAGQAVEESQEALQLADSLLGIIVSKRFYEEFENSTLPTHLNLVCDLNAHKDGFRKVQGIESEFTVDDKKAHFKPRNLLKKQMLSLGHTERQTVLPQLLQYLPSFLRIFTSTPEVPYAAMDLANHKRLMTVLVICLEVELDLNDQHSIEIIQGAVESIQKQVYRQKGAIVGIAYEGGVTKNGGPVGLEIVANWGEHSFNCNEASSHALLAAMSIQSTIRQFLLNVSNTSLPTMRASNKSLLRIGNSSIATEDGRTIESVELPLHCGLATGWVVQGVNGDFKNSVRYGVMELGETHERARGLMRLAQQDFGNMHMSSRVYCDSMTMQMARSFISCREKKHYISPNLLLNMPVFEPYLADPLEAIFSQLLNIKQAYRNFEQDIGVQGSLFKLCHNPLILDPKDLYNQRNNKIYDRATMVKLAINVIARRIKVGESSDQKKEDMIEHGWRGATQNINIAENSGNSMLAQLGVPYSVVVLGERGMGKSLFLRSMLINLREFEKLIEDQVRKTRTGKEKLVEDQLNQSQPESLGDSIIDFIKSGGNVAVNFKFAIGSSSPENRLDFLGAWQSIMRTILCINGNFNDKKPRKILSQAMIKHRQLIEDKVPLVQSFFKIYDLESEVKIAMQTDMSPPKKQNDWFQTDRYAQVVEREFMDFLLQVIIDLMEKMDRHFQKTKKDDENATRPVLVIFLDNVSGMNSSEWRFLELLQRAEHPYFQYLILVMAVEKELNHLKPTNRKTVSDLGFKISKEASTYYQDTIKPIELDFFKAVFELQPLEVKSIKLMLEGQADLYISQMQTEVDLMLAGVKDDEDDSGAEDGNTQDETQKGKILNDPLKNSYNIEQLKSQLHRKFQIFISFEEVDERLVKWIQKCTKGNALYALSLFHTLLVNGLAIVDEDEKSHKVSMSNKLITQLELYDENHISPLIIPPEVIAQGQIVFFDQKLENITEQEFGGFFNMVCYYILNVAALIGGIFSNKMLVDSKLCPATYQLPKYETFDLQKVLDTLEENDFIEQIDQIQDEVKYYRFCHVFLSNTLGQITLFQSFKKQIHFKLSEYFMTNSFKDIVTQFSMVKNEDLLVKQLLHSEFKMTKSQLTRDAIKKIEEKNLSLTIDKIQQQSAADDLGLITLRELRGHVFNSKDVEEELNKMKVPVRSELWINLVCRVTENVEDFFIKVTYKKEEEQKEQEEQKSTQDAISLQTINIKDIKDLEETHFEQLPKEWFEHKKKHRNKEEKLSNALAVALADQLSKKHYLKVQYALPNGAEDWLTFAVDYNPEDHQVCPLLQLKTFTEFIQHRIQIQYYKNLFSKDDEPVVIQKLEDKSAKFGARMNKSIARGDDDRKRLMLSFKQSLKSQLLAHSQQMGSGLMKVQRMSTTIRGLRTSLRNSNEQNERIFAAAQMKDLIRSRERIMITKERLKTFFALGMNKFCSHIGVAPIRPSIPTIYRDNVNDARTEISLEPSVIGSGFNMRPNLDRLVKKHPKLLEDGESKGVSRQSTLLEEAQQMMLLSNKRSGERETPTVDRTPAREVSSSSMQDEVEEEFLTSERSRPDIAHDHQSDTQDFGEEFRSEVDMQPNMPMTMDAHVASRQRLQPTETPHSARSYAQSGQSNPDDVPHLVKVLRRLAHQRRFWEITQLKKNAEHVQDVFYEPKVSLLQPLSLPFWGDAKEMALKHRKAGKRGVGEIKSGWDPRMDTSEIHDLDLAYKPFIEGPSIYKFCVDIRESQDFDIKSSSKSNASTSKSGRDSENRRSEVSAQSLRSDAYDANLVSYRDSVFEGKGQYVLACQHARRTFNENEIMSFQLKRRYETGDTQIKIDQMLGRVQLSDSSTSDIEMNPEMQRILASTITKVLDANVGENRQKQLEKLVMRELRYHQTQSRKQLPKWREPSSIIAETINEADESRLGLDNIVSKSKLASVSEAVMKMQASQRLLKTLEHNKRSIKNLMSVRSKKSIPGLLQQLNDSQEMRQDGRYQSLRQLNYQQSQKVFSEAHGRSRELEDVARMLNQQKHK